MRRMLRLVLVLVAASVFTINGAAQATLFSVTDVQFTNLIGNTDKFTWTLMPLSVSDFDLSVGGSYTFKYGTFSTSAFPISASEGSDKKDSFTASFLVSPPTPPSSESSVGTPDAIRVHRQNGSATVDFDNTPIPVSFGDGGQYTVTFLDPGTLTSNGSLDLNAMINFTSAPLSAPVDPPTGDGGVGAPIPEPGTLLLLGSGLIGLPIWRKRR